MIHFCELLLAFTILISCIMYVLSCTCAVHSDDEIYCRADWISHLLVSSSNPPEDQGTGVLEYCVEHLETFKMPENVTENAFPSTFDTLITPSDSIYCGLELETGEEYLLAGKVNGRTGYLEANICGQFMNMDKLKLGETSERCIWRSYPKSLIDRLHNGTFQC